MRTKKKKNTNHLISVVGFQHVNIIIEAWLNYCSLYLVYSQIWLKLPQDDHHLGYILKNSKNNIWCLLGMILSNYPDIIHSKRQYRKFSMCYFTILLCWQILTAFVVAILCALWGVSYLLWTDLQKLCSWTCAGEELLEIDFAFFI